MQRRATILVVDDDRSVRQALEINLTTAGFDVRLAHNGAAPSRAGTVVYQAIPVEHYVPEGCR